MASSVKMMETSLLGGYSTSWFTQMVQQMVSRNRSVSLEVKLIRLETISRLVSHLHMEMGLDAVHIMFGNDCGHAFRLLKELVGCPNGFILMVELSDD